jgi:hypothetical protein
VGAIRLTDLLRTVGADQYVSAMSEMHWCRGYIARARWRFAKTMPQWPHEYTVRGWAPGSEADFERMASLTRQLGVVKPWPYDSPDPRYHHAYLEIDGWEYWIMDGPVAETEVINRARVPVLIDTTFNFQNDTPAGRDPDVASDLLHRYHKALWSKPLPGGRPFDLEDVRGQGRYLCHGPNSAAPVWLRSDAVMQTFTRWERPWWVKVMRSVPKEEKAEFYNAAYTIGAMMVFPHNPESRAWSLNQARGFLAKIADRMDLTLECIRKHYRSEAGVNPLAGVLDRYDSFFKLFKTFDGYVEHFLLQDLVKPNGSVRFFLESEDFQRPAMPQDIVEWRTFRDRSVRFIKARNKRIKRLALQA